MNLSPSLFSALVDFPSREKPNVLSGSGGGAAFLSQLLVNTRTRRLPERRGEMQRKAGAGIRQAQMRVEGRWVGGAMPPP